MRKILLIDSECPYCTFVGKRLKHEFDIYSVRSEVGKEFTEEVFGYSLLDLVAYYPETSEVHTGKNAVSKIVDDKYGLGGRFSSITYPLVRDALDFIQNRSSTKVNKSVKVDKDYSHLFK